MCRQGGVEAGQPHVADDDDAERVLAVLEAVGQRAALELVADVRLPQRAVVGAAGHDHLDHAGLLLLGLRVVVLGAGPVGAERDELVVEVDADAAAHADDHRLAVHRLEAPFIVGDEVGGDELDALGVADEGLERGPLRFELLAAGVLLALGDLLELGVELRQLGGVEGQLGDAALVVDRHRGLVGDGPLDVVDADVVAEDRPRVRVLVVDGRAGEADERGIGKRVAHVAGEPVDEVVLAAVRLVGDDDDVPAVAQGGQPLALLGKELLDGREHHAAAGDLQELAQALAVGGLHGRLAEELEAALELAEELVVEVVAVGQDHQRRVLHRRVADHPGGVEQHREALAAALGVPDHARATVARLATMRVGRGAHAAGAHRLVHRGVDRVELVVARDDLVDGAAVRVLLEDDEVLEQVEEALRREHAAQQHLQLQGGLRCVLPSPSMVRQTLNHSWLAVSEPMRACKPSDTTRSAL